MSRLFVVSGPSGAGKSSLCTALLHDCPQLKLSISCTTRSPRPGEQDGREYHFLDVQSFEQQVASGAFLEWANVHGHCYGTRKSDVLEVLGKGDDVLLEIDWQGAAQVAEKMPGLMRIFILPPSISSLRERLQARGQDDATVIERRVSAAEAEMIHAGEADYQIVNDVFDQTLTVLRRLIEK